MAIAVFDTLRYSKRMKEAGFSESQAEIQAEALAEAFVTNFSELGTKADLKDLEIRLSGKIGKLESDMTLVKWILGVVAGGIISLVLKAFFI